MTEGMLTSFTIYDAYHYFLGQVQLVMLEYLYQGIILQCLVDSLI